MENSPIIDRSQGFSIKYEVFSHCYVRLLGCIINHQPEITQHHVTRLSLLAAQPQPHRSRTILGDTDTREDIFTELWCEPRELHVKDYTKAADQNSHEQPEWLRCSTPLQGHVFANVNDDQLLLQPLLVVDIG